MPAYEIMNELFFMLTILLNHWNIKTKCQKAMVNNTSVAIFEKLNEDVHETYLKL